MVTKQTKCLKALYLALTRPSNVHPSHLPLLIYTIHEGRGSGYLTLTRENNLPGILKICREIFYLWMRIFGYVIILNNNY